MTTLGNWLKERRKAFGYSQAEVGNKLGIAQAQVSALENDKIKPTKELEDKISALFGKFDGAINSLPSDESSSSQKRQMSDKAKEALKLYRETKGDGFYIQLDKNTALSADRHQYVLEQGTHKSYFTDLACLLKYMVASQVRQSSISSVEGVRNKLDEIWTLIDKRFANYDPAGIHNNAEEGAMEN